MPDKNGFPHFMLKEIFDQPQGLRDTIMPRDLPLGRVGRGDREVGGAAELLGDGQHPLDEPLEVRARRAHLAAREVDQLAAQAVADRAPEVLLDQPVLEVP